MIPRKPSDDGERTTVWLLAEGDVLRSGARVTGLQRDAVTRTVRVTTTSQPAGLTLPGDEPVVVVVRAY